jgi:hypothetical protein
MCNKCKGFSERLKINSSREYLDLVQQLDELVAAGTFRLIRGCPLKELLEHQQWPSDVITHIFECSNCGQASPFSQAFVRASHLRLAP